MSDNFFKDLNVFKSFNDVMNNDNYKIIPKDWYVIASDVKNSTTLIENGSYKDINFVASMTIMGIINIDKSVDIPYIFGGDGATILVPPSFIKKANKVLLDCKKLANELYSIELRTSSFLVEDLYKNDLDLSILKYEVSKDYRQTILKGNAIEFIDKSIRKNEAFSNDIDKNYEASFDGLECRWSELKAPKDEVLSLLIKVKNDDISKYKDILDNIEKIAGIYQFRTPVRNENLVITNSKKKLSTEVSLKSYNTKKVFAQYVKTVIENILGNILFKFGSDDWKGYKSRILRTCDTEKYENMLKMVISTKKNETKKLIEYLEEEFKSGNIVYGIHKSNTALMTCLIFQRHGNHVHFVDGNDGGYALAAKELKKKL